MADTLSQGDIDDAIVTCAAQCEDDLVPLDVSTLARLLQGGRDSRGAVKFSPFIPMAGR